MVLTYFSLLMPAFALLYAPAILTDDLLRLQNAPLLMFPCSDFGGMLEPRFIVRATAFDQ